MPNKLTTTQAYIMAIILSECLRLNINPNQATNPTTDSLTNFDELIAKAETQLLNNNYIALYFNRDESAVALEDFKSRQDLFYNYETDPDQTYNIVLNGNAYTIDITEDI